MSKGMFIREPIEDCSQCQNNPKKCTGCEAYVKERSEFIRQKLEKAELLKKESLWLQRYCRHGEEEAVGKNWVKRDQENPGYKCNHCQRCFQSLIEVSRTFSEHLSITDKTSGKILVEATPRPAKFIPRKP